MQWHGGVGFRALAGGLGAVVVLLRLDVVLGGLAQDRSPRISARRAWKTRKKERGETTPNHEGAKQLRFKNRSRKWTCFSAMRFPIANANPSANGVASKETVLSCINK